MVTDLSGEVQFISVAGIPHRILVSGSILHLVLCLLPCFLCACSFPFSLFSPLPPLFPFSPPLPLLFPFLPFCPILFTASCLFLYFWCSLGNTYCSLQTTDQLQLRGTTAPLIQQAKLRSNWCSALLPPRLSMKSMIQA